MKARLTDSDETNVTELEIAPDGRVYVFGASPEIMEILETLREQDELLLERLERGRSSQEIPRSSEETRIAR
jgi:hypothetical protein